MDSSAAPPIVSVRLPGSRLPGTGAFRPEQVAPALEARATRGRRKAPNESSPRPLPYLPGLDGLRSLAVIAVVLYHFDQDWLPGGFLGVEVFFVISGYIITSGLLAEWRQRGEIDVTGFWLRRARRLLPALFALLAVLLVAGVVFLPGDLPRLRSDALAAAAYVTNWNLVFGHRDYFESFGRPPLLQHLWSLAVEEQFYIVWPLLLAALLKVLRPRFAGLAVLGGALLSAALMALLLQDVYQSSRVYYGTDTRAAGLLLGSALAVAVPPSTALSRPRALLAAFLGVAGIAVLVAVMMRLGEYDPFLYRGGFLVTDLATAAVIVSVARPNGVLPSAVGFFPFRWLGTRSYSIYLWHWPLRLLVGRWDEAGDWQMVLLRLALVLLAAEASYRLIEMPARRGGLERLWRSLMNSPAVAWNYRQALAGIALAALVVGLAISVAAMQAPPARASHADFGALTLAPDPPAAGSVPQEPEPDLPLLFNPAPGPSPAVIAQVQPPPPAPPPLRPLPIIPAAPIPAGVRVTAVGDSVMLGAARQLAYVLGNVEIDASIGRQVSNGVDAIRDVASRGELGNVAVISLGSNGSFSARQFDQIMDILRDVKLVVFVNVRVPKPWEESTNRVIEKGVAAYPNTVLVDWHAVTEEHPELFGEDSVHLTGAGIRLYASLIAEAIIDNWR